MNISLRLANSPSLRLKLVVAEEIKHVRLRRVNAQCDKFMGEKCLRMRWKKWHVIDFG